MSYAGESAAKARARRRLWQRVVDRLGGVCGSDRFVVLAGPTGGDVGDLLTLGVSLSQISACDTGVEKSGRPTARACEGHWRARGLDLRVRREAVEVAVTRCLERDATSRVNVYLDFPGNLSAPTISTTLNVLRLVPPGSVLAFTVEYARDKEIVPPASAWVARPQRLAIRSGIGGVEGEYERWVARVASSERGERFVPGDAYKMLVARGVRDAAEKRARVMVDLLNAASSRRRLGLWYSDKYTGHRAHMLVAACDVGERIPGNE